MLTWHHSPHEWIHFWFLDWFLSCFQLEKNWNWWHSLAHRGLLYLESSLIRQRTIIDRLPESHACLVTLSLHQRLSLFAISEKWVNDWRHLFDSRRIQIPRSVTDKTISLCTSPFDVANKSRLEVKHSPGTTRENLMMAQFVSETASSLSCNQLFARKGLIAPTLLILSVGPTIITLSL